jgi:ABC-type transporter Mla subunit MlaD
MQSTSTKLRVAILGLVSMLLFFGLLAFLADWLPENGRTVKVRFGYAGPLHPGARVRLAGQTIGRVKGVRLLDEAERQVNPKELLEVTVLIRDESGHLVTKKSRFIVTTRGVLGEHYVEVVPGPPGADPVVGTQVIRGEDLPRTDLVLAQVQKLVDTMISVFEDDPDAARNFLRNANQLLAVVNRSAQRNEKAIDQLIVGLGAASQALADGIGDGSGLRAGINGMISATQVIGRDVPRMADSVGVAVTNLQTTFANVDGAASRVAGAAGSIDAVASRVDQLLDDPGSRVSELLTGAGQAIVSVNGLLASMSAVLKAIDRREGLLGALVYDPEPLEDFKELLHNLRKQPWKLIWKR